MKPKFSLLIFCLASMLQACDSKLEAPRDEFTGAWKTTLSLIENTAECKTTSTHLNYKIDVRRHTQQKVYNNNHPITGVNKIVAYEKTNELTIDIPSQDLWRNLRGNIQDNGKSFSFSNLFGVGKVSIKNLQFTCLPAPTLWKFSNVKQGSATVEVSTELNCSNEQFSNFNQNSRIQSCRFFYKGKAVLKQNSASTSNH